MNFEPAASDIGKLMAELLQLIIGMNVSPDEKKDLLIKSFGVVGAEFYEKMFNDNSELFNSKAIGTLGKSDLDDQTSRLAQKLLRNNALTRPTDQVVKGYFNSLLASAQDEAFKNAVSLGKVPTLTRSLRGETCKWCQARVGTWTNPTGELFARHDNCDCKIVVKGYNSRNGELKNYTKNSRKQDVTIEKNTKWSRESNIPVGLSDYEPSLIEEYDKIPIEVADKDYLFKDVYAKSGRNPYDVKLTNAELNLYEKLRDFNIRHEIIPPEPGISCSSDVKMLSRRWELKTRVATGDNTIKWAIINATDKGKNDIIIDVSYMDRPLSWVFEKIKTHLATNKNANKITGIIVVREGRLIRYK